jgi:menaquinone-dependent protoporphyrinogen IX oxidase
MKKVAIIFGTRHKTTIGIAEKIAEILIQNGFDVVLHNTAMEFSPERLLGEEFSGFILGSGIQMGQWNPDVKKFIVDNRSHFTKKGVKLGMFVTCGTTRSADKYAKGNTDYVDFFAKDLSLAPDLRANFGGVYDFSYHSNINIAIKFILKNKASIKSPGQIKINEEKDSVNWDDVITFAHNFSSLFLQ